MSNDVVPFHQMQRLAESIAKSRLFGIENADQALALMAIAQAEGKHPGIISRDFHIIQGKPSKKAEAMLRDFLSAGGKVEWHALSNEMADATFSHPEGGTVRISWDMKRAETAGLAGNAMYKKYPRQMLRSRCISEGCRTIAPNVTSGLYTPEELRDIKAEAVDVTPRIGMVAAVDAATRPKMPAAQLEGFCNSLSAAKDVKDLRTIFADAWKTAGDVRDGDAMLAINDAYNARQADFDAQKAAS